MFKAHSTRCLCNNNVNHNTTYWILRQLPLLCTPEMGDASPTSIRVTHATPSTHPTECHARSRTCPQALYLPIHTLRARLVVNDYERTRTPPLGPHIRGRRFVVSAHFVHTRPHHSPPGRVFLSHTTMQTLHFTLHTGTDTRRWHHRFHYTLAALCY